MGGLSARRPGLQIDAKSSIYVPAEIPPNRQVRAVFRVDRVIMMKDRRHASALAIAQPTNRVELIVLDHHIRRRLRENADLPDSAVMAHRSPDIVKMVPADDDAGRC